MSFEITATMDTENTVIHFNREISYKFSYLKMNRQTVKIEIHNSN